MAIDLSNLRKLRAYLDALLQASEVLAEEPPKPVEAKSVDLAAWAVSQRNRVLAGSGDKADLLGTLSTAPVVDDKVLAAVGADAEIAKAIITARDELRSAALALTAEAKP
jgi:hypothetical protein